MKIIQVLPYFCFGGAETMCENLTCALRNLGHEVTVVSLYNEHTPISQRMEAAGVPIRYLDKKLGLDLSMISKLTAIFWEEKPDVVHTHLDVIKYAVPAAKLAGVRRCVHTVHNIAQQEAGGRLQKWVNAFFFRRGWSVPVALSPQVGRTIQEYYGLPEAAVPIVYNGTDLSRCQVKEDYCLENPVQLLHIGRFNPQKNHERVVEAFALLCQRYPKCHLTLVGDGEGRQTIQELAQRREIADKITFAGVQSNVYPYLAGADLFLLPSDYEGIPMTIIEAMGTGLPIVATAVGGVPDMLEDQQSGLLVPCDTQAVADACARLAEDQTLREKLGRAALADSVRFSAQTMAKGYLSIYQN